MSADVTLVDTNVLLDVATESAEWGEWSQSQPYAAARRGPILINDVVYAEVSVGYDRIGEVEAVLDASCIEVAPVPREALLLAGKAFRRYCAAGGPRASVLPDFFVGLHAAVVQIPLLTRDVRRYRTHVPTVRLLTPYG